MEEDDEDGWGLFGTAVELAVIGIIARTLGSLPDDLTNVKAAMLAARDLAEAERVLKRCATAADDRIGSLFDGLADECDRWAAPFYAASGATQARAAENPFTAHHLNAGQQRASKAVQAIMRTSVVGIIAPDNTVKPIGTAYRQWLTEAVDRIRRGEPNELPIAEAVAKLARHGLQVTYPSGRHRELYSAVSMNVMDGYRATMAAVRDQQAAEFGANGYEVSAHGLCATDHLPYQGRQYTFEEFRKVQNSLKRPIAEGRNCRHRLTKVIVGISSERTARELREFREASTRQVTFTGLDGRKRQASAYSFSQYQRQVEQAIRRNTLTKKALEEAGLDTAATKRRNKALVAAYDGMCRQAKVPPRPDRYRVYELS